MIGFYTAPIEKIFDEGYEKTLRAEALPGSGFELRSLYGAQLAALADAHFQGDISFDLGLFNDIWERREQLDFRLGLTAISGATTESKTGQQG